MAKRLIFSSNTPNDKGGIVRNEVLDFSRFVKNPVCLREHKWGDFPIGRWTDYRLDGKYWSGIPELHEITELARTTKQLYEADYLRGASIGGEAIWKADPSGRKDKDGYPLPYVNKDGYMECLKFIVYEISIVTLPSNEDAVTMDDDMLMTMEGFSARIYDREEIAEINRNITNLSSQFKINPVMETVEEKKPETTPAAPAAKPVPVTLAASDDIMTMKASALPDIITRILAGFSSILPKFSTHSAVAPSPTGLPETKPASDSPLHVPQNTPIGLKSQAKAKMNAAILAAGQAIQNAQALRAKAEDKDAKDEDKTAYSSAMEAAQTALSAAQTAHTEFTAFGADDDDEEMGAKKPSTHSAAAPAAPAKPTGPATQTGLATEPKKPTMKTPEQLEAELKLAATPDPNKARVKFVGNGKTFSELAADPKEGRSILNRVMARDARKDLADYSAVLNSFIEDGKFSAVTEKMRIMMNVDEAHLGDLRANPNHRGAGLSLTKLAADLAAGEIEYMDQHHTMKKFTTFSSTDNALAAPALNTIEWLPLAIFKLFPSTGWKNSIPILPAQMTGANTGLIWANISADPTIYKGTQPTNPANYQYGDDAVALSLTPYWLQPMLWNPLSMHQLRYDQMATGWAQAFSKLNSVIDDNLLYSLASTVPTGSITYTTGLSGYQTQPATFQVNGTQLINNFYWNPAFQGSLTAPTLNDILTTEQLYNQQNFPMEEMDAVLIYDPIMEAYLKKDPEAKNLLTRWVNADGANLLKFSHTIFNQRSRVAIYDPASGQVKDPNSSIPATALSASLGIIPSQVAIGLGMLDVFMVQDPTNYGYKMSADLRMGAVPVRKDFTGTSLFTFGPVV